jgi:hypothetical protein
METGAASLRADWLGGGRSRGCCCFSEQNCFVGDSHRVMQTVYILATIFENQSYFVTVLCEIGLHVELKNVLVRIYRINEHFMSCILFYYDELFFWEND